MDADALNLLAGHPVLFKQLSRRAAPTLLTPHPLEAARLLGVAPQACLYVGDDERDIVAGRAAGMFTVAARYGYLGESGVTSHWEADAEIDFPTEVLKLLQLP